MAGRYDGGSWPQRPPRPTWQGARPQSDGRAEERYHLGQSEPSGSGHAGGQRPHEPTFIGPSGSRFGAVQMDSSHSGPHSRPPPSYPQDYRSPPSSETFPHLDFGQAEGVAGFALGPPLRAPTWQHPAHFPSSLPPRPPGPPPPPPSLFRPPLQALEGAGVDGDGSRSRGSLPYAAQREPRRATNRSRSPPPPRSSRYGDSYGYGDSDGDGDDNGDLKASRDFCSFATAGTVAPEGNHTVDGKGHPTAHDGPLSTADTRPSSILRITGLAPTVKPDEVGRALIDLRDPLWDDRQHPLVAQLVRTMRLRYGSDGAPTRPPTEMSTPASDARPPVTLAMFESSQAAEGIKKALCDLSTEPQDDASTIPLLSNASTGWQVQFEPESSLVQTSKDTDKMLACSYTDKERGGLFHHSSRPDFVELWEPFSSPAAAVEAESGAMQRALTNPAVETDDSKAARTKTVPVIATSKKVALNISKWNQKQEELRTSTTGTATDARLEQTSSSRVSAPEKTDSKSIEVRQSLKADDLPAAPLTDTDRVRPAKASAAAMSEDELRSFDYLDRSQHACLLCQRKLKSLEVLQRHERESALHKGNLENLETCRAGVDRKLHGVSSGNSSGTSTAPAGFAPIGSAKESSSQPAPKYRDRALERRAVFGADASPAPPRASNMHGTKSYEGPVAPPSSTREETPEPAPEKEIDSDNIGSKMLAMMGWTKGQGLGASSQGRTDIVETRMYAKGAGLGSARPSEASTKAQVQAQAGGGWKAYVKSAKEGARERYNEGKDP